MRYAFLALVAILGTVSASAQSVDLSRNERLTVALSAAMEALPTSTKECRVKLGAPSETDSSGPVRVTVACGGNSWAFLADQNPYGRGFRNDDMSARIAAVMHANAFEGGLWNADIFPVFSTLGAYSSEFRRK